MRLPAYQKLRILQRVLKDGASASAVCRQNKISRKTFYTWKKKYLAAGPRNKSSCLEKHHLRGLQHPRASSFRFKKEILSLAALHPEWGSHKISQKLKAKDQKLGNHGVYTLLKECRLQTYQKREEFASLYRSPLRLLPEARKRVVENVVLAKRGVGFTAKEFLVSRKTIWKWAIRYKKAREAQTELLLALKDQNPTGVAHPRGTPGWLEKKILDLVVKNPEYSSHKLAVVIPEIGNHGIQNVLLRNSLNTFDRRLEYARLHAPAVQVQPVTSWLGRLKSVWETFVPQVAPAPPPVFKERIFSFLRPFALSLFSTILFSTLFVFWLEMLTSHPGDLRIGLFFASLSLLVGTFFFIYSMKYYFTLALVLSFSTQTGPTSPEASRGEGNGNGWLAKIFGVANGSLRGLTSLKSSTEVRPPPGGGLQPNLDHIKLSRYPFISIHLPFYNEKNVVNRILAACTSFDYPHYEVIVCDDSTDETVQILKDWENHPKVKILHRSTREGFKGGALKSALKAMDPKTEFVLVFDADFVPYPDTLTQFMKYFKATGGWEESKDYQATKLQTMPYETFSKTETSTDLAEVLEKQVSDLRQKSQTAVVAGYQWHVLNKSENWITRGVRTEYAGSYVIERPGQEILGAMKIIHGSVYCIRADVLKHFGWGTSITEDFELTLRIYEQGFKVAYTPYVQAPSECVSTIKRLIRQRMRWAEGHSFNVRRMFWKLLMSPKLTLTEKAEFLYISPYYLQAFFFLLGTFSWLISETLFPARLPFWTSLWGWSLVLTNFFALPLMNAVGLFLEESEEKDYLGLFSFVALSYLLVPFQGYASVKGFLEKQEGPWFRTPKTGLITDIFTRGRFYRLIMGILPGRRLAPVTSQSFTPWSPEATLRGYFALATSNNQFNGFGISRRQVRFLGRTTLVFLLILAISLSIAGSTVNLLINPLEKEKTAQLSNMGIGEVKLSGDQPAKKTSLNEEIRLVSNPRRDFNASQTPNIHFKFKSEEKKKDVVSGIFTPKKVEASSDSDFSVSLFDHLGREVDVELDVVRKEEGDFEVKVPNLTSLTPGIYKLKATLTSEGKTYIQEQDFSWGVLAINTNKSIYLPGETAYLQMAALKDDGRTLCDADLTLEITSPSGQVTYPQVEKSNSCLAITDKPDYASFYQVQESGIYHLKLVNNSNGYEVSDTFKARLSVPFDIERIGPTRIYPPDKYEMTLRIKVNENFSGEIKEYVPNSFDLNFQSNLNVQISNDQKIITWQADWKGGESYELKYQFDAPDISPYLYLLGPLKIGELEEARQWQIASDAITVTTLGTNQDKNTTQSWTTLSSIALSTGDSIIVVVSYDGNGYYSTNPYPSITWNGQALSNDKNISSSYDANGVGISIQSLHNVTGATGNVVINWSSGTVPVAQAMTAYKASGLATSSTLDKSNTGTGTGTDASTGSTGTLSQADELAIAATGVEDEVDDANGTWTTGSGYVSGNTQFNATNAGADASNVQAHSVAMVVSSTAALQGVDAGHDSSDWAAAVATYKMLTTNVAQAHYRWRNDDGKEVLAGWPYRKPIIITGATAEQTNYQVPVTVSYVSGKMNSDFSDIRFTSSDGTLLDHWRESYTSSSTATFWVEMPTIPASPSTATIYMYYGNTSATTASSLSNTALWADEFSSDGGYWVSRNGTWAISGGYLTQSSTTAYDYAENWFVTNNSISSLLTNNYSVVIKQRYTSTWTSSPESRIGIVTDNNGTSSDISSMLGLMHNDGTSKKAILDNRQAWSSTSAFTPTQNTWYWHEFSKTGGNFRYRAWQDGSSTPDWEVTWARTGYSDKNIGVSGHGVTNDTDLIYERKFVSPEPSVGSAGSEETGGGTWKEAEDTQITGQNKSENVRVRFSVNNTGGSTSYSYRLGVAAKTAATCEDQSTGWSDVPTTTGGCGSAVACMTTSTYFADGDATTRQLSIPGGSTFTAGKMVEDSSNQTTAITLDQNYFTEVEYNFQFTSNAADSTTYCFRVTNAGSAITTYSKVATVVTIPEKILFALPILPFLLKILRKQKKRKERKK